MGADPEHHDNPMRGAPIHVLAFFLVAIVASASALATDLRESPSSLADEDQISTDVEDVTPGAICEETREQEMALE